MQLQPRHVAPFAALVLLVGVGRLAAGFPPDQGTQVAASSRALTQVPAGQPAVEVAPVAETAPEPGVAAANEEREIQPAPESFEGPPAPSSGCASRPAPAPSGGVWAVIVGINDYPGGGHDLVSSVNDAKDMDQALSRMGVPSGQRTLLLDGAASSCGVQSALDWLVAGAGPDATAVFYYAGHARKLSASSRTIVTADGELFTDSELGASLSRLASSRAWIAMATCYGGGFTQVLGPGRILTGAADADSLAYENVALGRSYMGEYMVRRAMLEGAAPTSVEAAFAYARSAIAAERPGRVPVQFDQAAGEIDLRSGPTSAVAAAPAPAGGGQAVTPPRPPPPSVTPTTRPCRPVLLILCTRD